MTDNDDKTPADPKNMTVLWAGPDEGRIDGAAEPSLRIGPGSYAPSSLPRPARLADGALLNHIYEIRGLIARGGMAEVYQGVNALTDEHVAIKVILPHLAEDPAVEAMFLREARTLLRLGHPALVQYRLAARDPLLGVLYLVTEFVDGVGLDEAMAERVAPSLTESIALTRRLADGLATAHALGAIHRDLSPDNILLPGARLEDAKIIDFGIAKDIATTNPTILGNAFAGKLNFVAPEQLGDFGRHIGPWTDIYSLGLVMLAVSSGKEVDMGESLVDAVDRRRAGPDLSGAPEALRPVFERMLQGDPALRYRSMREVIDGLDALQSATAAPAMVDVVTAPPAPVEVADSAIATPAPPLSADGDSAPGEPEPAGPVKETPPRRPRAGGSRKTSAPAPSVQPAAEPVVEAQAPKPRRRTTTRVSVQAVDAPAPDVLGPSAPAPAIAASAGVPSGGLPAARAEPSGGGMAGSLRAATPFLVLAALVLLGVTVALLVMRPPPPPVREIPAPAPAVSAPVSALQAPSIASATTPAPPPVAPAPVRPQTREKRRKGDDANRIPAGEYKPSPTVQVVAPSPVVPPPAPVPVVAAPVAPPAAPPKKKNLLQTVAQFLKDKKPQFPVKGARSATPPPPATPTPAPASAPSPPQ